jgi:DNA polymerase delta subunit 1
MLPSRAPQREHKLASYTLNAVAEHFLADRKEEVPYAHIAALFAGGADSVQRLARYCVKDAWLPLRLMRHTSMLVNQVRGLLRLM